MPNDPLTTFLVIEDDENDVFFFERTVRKAGINNPIQVVHCGHEAIQYLAGNEKFADRSLYPLPSLVFLDLHLPGKSGLEVLSWMRQQPDLASIVVVLLTASKEEASIATAYAIGANSYLVKPPTIDSVQVLIEALDQYRLGIEPHNSAD